MLACAGDLKLFRQLIKDAKKKVEVKHDSKLIGYRLQLTLPRDQSHGAIPRKTRWCGPLADPAAICFSISPHTSRY